MTDPFLQGLTPTLAAERLRSDGPNELGAEKRQTLLATAMEVAREPMFLLLMGAGGVYLAMGDAHEALVLLGFVVIIMTITILQERRTERALAALRDLSSPRAVVVRDGAQQRIPGVDVVRDDILVLSEGDRIPADGLVLQAHELAVDESLLSGESDVVNKFAGTDKVFAGTLVVRGQGIVQVTCTGARTELGRIGKSLQDVASESSPLHEEMSRFTRRLAVIGVGLCVALAVTYGVMRADWAGGLLAGITLAMGILPQEFPVIMIVFFAMGARRIAQHKVLTRRLNAIETLGETTVLCVDKTGTLTQNRMALAALVVDGERLDVRELGPEGLPESCHELLEYVVLASETDPHDPMEQAFIGFAQTHLAQTEHLHPQWQLAREYEISPEQLAMSHLWRNETSPHDVVAAKGAPEAICDLCHMAPSQHQHISELATAMADDGLRVLGVAKARHSVDNDWPAIQHDFDFEFVGLVGLVDPLRPDVPDAVTECRQAGIRVIMITGDHPRTARTIASQAGIDATQVITGADLAGLDKPAQTEHIRRCNVFARVSPAQKLEIVNALKANNEVVAMTGDGVNDAPALKSAHIGIAMGKRGTDVAREAASLVLLEDNFAAIVAAIHQGRRIFANLRQALIYTLAVHMPIIGLSMFPVLFGWPLILMPVHIAFLELVIDPACSIVFEAESGSDQLMKQPPRASSAPLVSPMFLLMGLLQGGLVTVAALTGYVGALNMGVGVDEARTLAFIVLVVANAVLILSLRGTSASWGVSMQRLSPVAIWVLAATFAGLAAITLIPMLADAFGFVRPLPERGALAVLAGVAMLLPFQLCRVLLRRVIIHP